MEKINFWPGRNAQNRFLDVLIPMAQVLRLYIQMFLSYGLYVCIIFDTAHHRATFGIFWNSTQNTTPEENIQKMFHISSLIALFSYGKVKDVFWIRIKFHLGRAKARGKSGVWGAKPKLRYLFAKFPLLSKIQTWSQRMLVRHTSNHNHCDWHVQKPLCQDFQVILNNSSWSKTTLCIVKEQIWLQNMKCYGKKLFWPERNAQNGFILHAYRLLDVQIPMTQVLRLHIQMFLSYGLYVYIIFDTAHHRATFGIFWNSTQNTTLKKISRKCSIFLHWLHFFLMGRSRMFFWIRIKFSSGEGKSKG